MVDHLGVLRGSSKGFEAVQRWKENRASGIQVAKNNEGKCMLNISTKRLSGAVATLTLLSGLTLPAWAQETAGTAEPSLSQKLIFYGITIAGVAFLVAAWRRSKWGRKK